MSDVPHVHEADEAGRFDVFVSYYEHDYGVALAIAHAMEARRIRCFVAKRDIPAGVDWPVAIMDALEGSRVFVLVFSGGANSSRHVARELVNAVESNLTIIPFKIEDVPLSPTLRYYIRTRHWLDALTLPIEQHLNRLAERVEALLGPREPTPRGVEQDSNEVIEHQDEGPGSPDPARGDPRPRRPCQVCAELILEGAVRCRYCGAGTPPTTRALAHDQIAPPGSIAGDEGGRETGAPIGAVAPIATGASDGSSVLRSDVELSPAELRGTLSTEEAKPSQPSASWMDLESAATGSGSSAVGRTRVEGRGHRRAQFARPPSRGRHFARELASTRVKPHLAVVGGIVFAATAVFGLYQILGDRSGAGGMGETKIAPAETTSLAPAETTGTGAAISPKGFPADFAYELAVLDRVPELSNRDSVGSIMERLYPRLLQDAGIGGTVVMQFVIESDGTVDMSTAKVLDSDNDQLSEASMNAIEHFRFRPGQYEGEDVRVLIQMPITWLPAPVTSNGGS